VRVDNAATATATAAPAPAAAAVKRQGEREFNLDR
jgi:hypothetical protein